MEVSESRLKMEIMKIKHFKIVNFDSTRKSSDFRCFQTSTFVSEGEQIWK